MIFRSQVLGAFFALGSLASPLQDVTTEAIVYQSRAVAAPNAGIDKDLLETFAYFSEYTAAAYCGPQQGRSRAKVTCGTSRTCDRVEKSDTKVVETWYSVGTTGATGFVAIDKTKRLVVISLRGSVDVANWVADMRVLWTECPEYGGKGARCSTGFLTFWKESQKKAVAAVEQALKDYPDFNIAVTGHSLGGAAAVYAAADMRAKYPDKDVYLYTFGQPRAGNDKLSEFITKQGKNYRVTHTSDAVPKLPPESSGMGEKYAHISPEYWISDGLGNNAAKYKVLEGLHNYNGNAGTSNPFNIIAHIQYFSTNMYYCAMPISMGIMGGQGTKV